MVWQPCVRPSLNPKPCVRPSCGQRQSSQRKGSERQGSQRKGSERQGSQRQGTAQGEGGVGAGGMARQVARPVVLVDEHSKTAKFKFASRREAARAVGSSKCVLSRLCQANARAFDAVHGLSLSPPLSLSLSLSLCLSVSVSLSLSLSLSLCRACARSLSLLRARSLSRAPSPCAGGLNVQG